MQIFPVVIGILIRIHLANLKTHKAAARVSSAWKAEVLPLHNARVAFVWFR